VAEKKILRPMLKSGGQFEKTEAAMKKNKVSMKYSRLT
jgi:hypothetical protein